jgi:glycosyltransferase involved in cell wall biosynthesis
MNNKSPASAAFAPEPTSTEAGKLKIALLHDSVLPPKDYGGIERIVLALAAEYERLGHEIVVLCRKGSSLKDFKFAHLPAGYGSDKSASWLPRGVDFLHSHQPLAHKPQVPFLITIHGNGHPGESYFPNTNFLSESHCRNHGAKFLVYNGIDLDRYPFCPDKQDYFVFLARTTWRVKNVKTAIAWARDLGARLEIMGGDGPSRGGIRYRGLVGEKEKLELLAGARALIYPTNWDEPCAAAPLEALACGTPVIASANGCMPELVRPGTGAICETYEQLLRAAGAVRSLDPAACRRSVQENFSVQRMARDYLALMRRILREGELPQQPSYRFNPSSVRLLYKPTWRNRLRLAVLGKV